MNLTEKFVKLLIDGFSHKITETEVQVTSDLLLDGLSVAALGSMEAGPQMLYLMANNIDQSASATVTPPIIHSQQLYPRFSPYLRCSCVAK